MQPSWHRHLHGSDFAEAIAFIVPYAAVLVVFAFFPIAYGFWISRSPSIYIQPFASDEYWSAVVSTVLYVGIGVNATKRKTVLMTSVSRE